MAEAELELYKVGVPVKTRHNEVAPSQYRDRADLRERQRRHRSSDDDDGDPAQDGAEVRPRLPDAREAVCRRQRLRQASQLEHGRRPRQQPAEPGRDAARQHAVPVLLRRGHPRGGRVAGPAAHEHRQRRQRSSARRQRSAAGDPVGVPRRHAHRHLRPDRGGPRADRPSTAATSTSASRCCRSCRATPAIATARRRSPSPATSSSSARCRRTRASPSRPRA